ncbi:MAG: hypothetical protein AAF564_00605 [Bacteroidota bacterium]
MLQTPVQAQETIVVGGENTPENVLPDTLVIPEPEFEFDFAVDLGMSRIENSVGKKEQFFATALMPEFYYGEYSAGLLLKMHLRLQGGSTRKEDYDSFNDFLSIIRFVQFAEKGVDGYYGRFGELEETTLGFGQFINLFNNSISLDDQKRGFEVNYRTKDFLVEGIYSNLLAPEVFGLRGAYFPLTSDPVSRYRLVSFGVSLAGDLGNKGTLVNVEIPGAPFLVDALTDDNGIRTAVGNDDGKLLMGGFDASMPIFLSPTSTGLAYAEVSKIFGHGMGIGAGITGNWDLPDEGLRLEIQFEQRFMGKAFIPNYFNSLYEALRLQTLGIPVDGDDDVEALNTRRNILTAQTKRRFGSYFTMAWRYKRMWKFRWSFENAWNVKDSAWIHADVRVKSRELPVYLRLRFDQLRTASQEELITTGNNLNFFRLETAVRVMSMLMLGVGVRNSFEADFHEGIPIGLKKRRRIEPKFVLIFPPQKKKPAG